MTNERTERVRSDDEAQTLEELRRRAKKDESADAIAKNAVRKMTDGQDRDVSEDEDEPVEELAGTPMHVSGSRELTRSDTPPDDASAEPFPTAVGQGD